MLLHTPLVSGILLCVGRVFCKQVSFNHSILLCAMKADLEWRLRCVSRAGGWLRAATMCYYLCFGAGSN